MLLLSDTKKLIRVIIGFEPFQPTNKNIKKIFFSKERKELKKSYVYQKIIKEKIRQIECGFFLPLLFDSFYANCQTQTTKSAKTIYDE